MRLVCLPKQRGCTSWIGVLVGVVVAVAVAVAVVVVAVATVCLAQIVVAVVARVVALVELHESCFDLVWCFVVLRVPVDQNGTVWIGQKNWVGALVVVAAVAAVAVVD